MCICLQLRTAVAMATQTNQWTNATIVIVCDFLQIVRAKCVNTPDKGQRWQSYLDGRHLCVTSPAEVWELKRVVAESHRSSVQHGSLLNLKLEMVEVGEVMIRTRPAERAKSLRWRRCTCSPFEMYECALSIINDAWCKHAKTVKKQHIKEN